MEESIITGNKLIAEFDGCWLKYPNHDDKSSKHSLWLYPRNHTRHARNDTLGDMKYDSSWDWLMPIVEKIECLGCKFQICRRQVNILKDEVYPLPIIEKIKEETKLQSVWQAVIQFIEWYNKEQSAQESLCQ